MNAPVVAASKTKAILVMLSGLLYGASPIDLIPDIVPLLGWSDDAVVLLTAGVIAFRLLRRQRQAMKARTSAGTLPS
ncbi:MAG: DUF1232 domain-containing protein [Methanoregulaceae archaeon]|nr:DUF1232 domain-containing protein [Methanoregulaceae archaeon]